MNPIGPDVTDKTVSNVENVVQRKKKMRSGEFIALCASSMMLTALGIDIMLPAFAELRRHFGLSAESTAPAQIISFFFMGQVVQVVFGALSDRYGRLAILRIGFPLYIVGGIAATYAPDFTWMLTARFAAGVGASAVFMTTIAGVRDRFVGNQMARTMSLVFTIFLFTPVVAPFLGMAILSVASWQAVFLTPPLFAVLVFVWSLRLEESLPSEKRRSLEWKSVSETVRSVVGNKAFLRYTIFTTLLFSALSSYVGSSEHIVKTIYGRPELFAWIFAGIGLFMSFCSLLNSRLTMKYGARRAVRGLLIAYTLIATFLLLWSLVTGDPPNLSVFFGCIGLMLGINLAIEPNSSALALEPMGEMAGMASSIYGTIFFTVGATLGAVVSGLLVSGVFPLVMGFFVIAVLGMLLVFSDRKAA